ncbi:MAG: hypothetical protein JST64_13850 [Actinobacteria bacterium]|nr:hypothetical protein [Actinomycetota bacterium]
MLVITLTSGCGGSSDSISKGHETASADLIGVQVALEKATAEVKSGSVLIFVSNTGVLSFVDPGSQTLLVPNKRAATQWVFEFAAPNPTPVTAPDGASGHEYEMARIAVRSDGAIVLPSASLSLRDEQQFIPVPVDPAKVIDVALDTATKEASHASANASVAFRCDALGSSLSDCVWVVRYYEGEDLVDQVLTSADGTRVVPKPDWLN